MTTPEEPGLPEVFIVEARGGGYFARVRWSTEIRSMRPSITRTLYTACVQDSTGALALAAVIVETGRGLASPPPTR